MSIALLGLAAAVALSGTTDQTLTEQQILNNAVLPRPHINYTPTVDTFVSPSERSAPDLRSKECAITVYHQDLQTDRIRGIEFRIKMYGLRFGPIEPSFLLTKVH